MADAQRVLLDLGCGSRKQPGAIGVDIARVPQVDIVADVTRPLPFRSDSVDAIYASHLLEHLDNLGAFMNEVWRICKPGALVQFRFPHGTTPFGIWRDPTHQRGLFLDTFDYFDPNTFDGRMFGYYNAAKFEMVKQRLYYNMNADTWVPNKARRIAGRLFDALANRDERAQYICERFWGQLVGMEEAQIWMRALK